jgi:DNA-binding response OmpR family regulator
VKFLVVEEERYIAELLQQVLERLGNTCLLAGTAAQAQQMLGEHAVEALTLDLGMPDQAGLDWLESVARDDPDLARRTLVITGSELERESVERLARCGAGVLAKPFTLDSLQEAVQAQIAHAQAHD